MQRWDCRILKESAPFFSDTIRWERRFWRQGFLVAKVVMEYQKEIKKLCNKLKSFRKIKLWVSVLLAADYNLLSRKYIPLFTNVFSCSPASFRILKQWMKGTNKKGLNLLNTLLKSWRVTHNTYQNLNVFMNACLASTIWSTSQNVGVWGVDRPNDHTVVIMNSPGIGWWDTSDESFKGPDVLENETATAKRYQNMLAH